MRRMVFNLLCGLLVLLFFWSGSHAPKDAQDQFNLPAFARLPLKDEGRIKPIDTVARNLLKTLSGRQSCKTEDGDKRSATEWLLDLVSDRPEALNDRVVKIENADVLSMLELEDRKGRRYSFNEISPNWDALISAAQAARFRTASDRDAYDRQLIKLTDALSEYRRVISAFHYAENQNADHLPRLIPPQDGSEEWLLLGECDDSTRSKFMALLEAYQAQDALRFNQALSEYEKLLQSRSAPLRNVRLEEFYNRLNIFIKSVGLYLFVFLLSCFGWLSRKDRLLQCAQLFLWLAFIPHTLGIVARMILSGYPPITNLYSSVVFVGWGGAAAGLIIERRAREKLPGTGCLIGSVVGFITLLIAHSMAGDGDTIEQMSAILNSRFWLAVHVVTISLGYIAALVAGLLGVITILAGSFSRRIESKATEELARMLYATTCFALLLTFIGTMLGGLWADIAWGRFWGWDPKENGALLIILWNTIMLYARRILQVGLRGFSVMATFGNAVTAWSWFGVNQLGIGLHAYGFTDAGNRWLSIFILSQLAICALGLLSPRLRKL